MHVSSFFSLYLISVPIFFLIDMLWLGVIAKDFYQTRIGHLMEINWGAAIIFYVIFLLGLTYFVTYPAITDGVPWKAVLLGGALFGFFTYATYDLTNLATLRGWPLDLVLVDMLWGTVLGGSVATIAWYVYTLFQS
ncbi:MAG: hypothetical protein RL097_242 [Candidatus Parcubacteria bacterium]